MLEDAPPLTEGAVPLPGRLGEGADTDRLLRRMIETTTVGMTLTDPNIDDNPLVYVNQGFCRMSGYQPDEVLGLNCRFMAGDCPDPEVRERIHQGLKSLKPFRVELLNYRKDGEQFWVDLHIYPLFDEDGRLQYFVGTQTDITARKRTEFERVRLELELRQSQKFEALGTLAGGVAHEINTPIQYVGDNTHFLRDAFGDIQALLADRQDLLAHAEAAGAIEARVAASRALDKQLDVTFLTDEIPTSLEQSLDGVERVSSIVQAIKEFAHPGSQEKTPVDINRAIRSTITVSRNQWKYVADLDTDFDPELPAVACLPGEFNQLMLNLIVNAAQAMEEKGEEKAEDARGNIRVSTRLDGDWAVIEVADTGCGIPERLQHKIFDPFFTTKGVGKGSGQGLTLAFNIVVKKHGGTIDVTSAVGEGTTFTVRLPVEDAGDVGQAG